MKKNILIAALLATGALASTSAMAQAAAEGPWMVRVRAVNIDSANDDGTPLGLTINNKVIPEIDFTYFFTPNLAAELILTVPQEHTVKSKGAEIGTLKHLPPTLTLQYHFTGGSVKPYLGAGINFTRFSDINLPAGVDVKRDSWGPALQVGVDIPLSKGVVLNFDVKKVYLGTDVSSNGVNLGSFKVDPLLVGVGIGWRF